MKKMRDLITLVENVEPKPLMELDVGDLLHGHHPDPHMHTFVGDDDYGGGGDDYDDDGDRRRPSRPSRDGDRPRTKLVNVNGRMTPVPDDWDTPDDAERRPGDRRGGDDRRMDRRDPTAPRDYKAEWDEQERAEQARRERAERAERDRVERRRGGSAPPIPDDPRIPNPEDMRLRGGRLPDVRMPDVRMPDVRIPDPRDVEMPWDRDDQGRGPIERHFDDRADDRRGDDRGGDERRYRRPRGERRGDPLRIDMPDQRGQEPRYEYPYGRYERDDGWKVDPSRDYRPEPDRSDSAAVDAYGEPTTNSDARGYRNNNPLNVEYQRGNEWQGQIGHDGRFARFRDIEQGIRAAEVTLMNYQEKHGLDTVREMIGRWAPSNENNTNAYVNYVARAMGVDPDQHIDIVHNERLRARMIRAMVKVETGQDPWRGKPH